MSSYIFDSIKSKVANGTIKFVVPNNTFYMALVGENVFNDFNNGALSDSENWSNISVNEITNITTLRDNGYEIRPVQNIHIEETSSNGFTTSILKANDIIYSRSDIDAYGAVIFKNSLGSYSGGNPVYDGPLITAIDFKGRVSSTAGAFSVFLSEGFLRIQ